MDLAGVGLAGEDLAGVEAGAGAGKKAKAETRVVCQIMHTPTRATPTIESFTPNGSRKSDLVVICLHGALHIVLTRMK